MIHRIALLGVGLVGGSLGLALRRHRPDLHLTGYDRPDVLDLAVEKGVIHDRAATPADAVRHADLVVLAVPLGPMMTLLEAIAPHLKAGATVTDVGSVKRPVVAQAREVLPSTVTFVGGHPMAGAEQGGLAHANALLFENATYVLCPPLAPDGTPMDHARFSAEQTDLIGLVQATGARVLLLDPEPHDHIAAAVSHLPQLLAVTLMQSAAAHPNRDAFLQLAAGGFRDMTRIASSPFGLWHDILVANEGPILDAFGRLATALQKTRHRLAEGAMSDLETLFDEARTARQGIPRDMKGFLQPLADVFVYAQDEPGFLLRVVQVVYNADLNIKDIELLKIREGTGGTFRLGFRTEADAQRAIEALLGAGFHAHRMDG